MAKTTSSLDRFWSKVEKTESCWLWRGTLNPRGQAVFYADGSMRKAQRWLYGQLVGNLVEYSWIVTTCDESLCVLPEHLPSRNNKGHRTCKTCRSAYEKARRARMRAQRVA